MPFSLPSHLADDDEYGHQSRNGQGTNEAQWHAFCSRVYQFRTGRLCISYGSWFRLTEMSSSEIVNKHSAKLSARFWRTPVFWLAVAALVFTLLGEIRLHSQTLWHGPLGTVPKLLTVPVLRESPILGGDRAITRYAEAFDGDPQPDVATVVEQALASYTRYTLRLRLASGAEQTIAVTAPPGGLQLEMRDMTGDSVQNDLIVTPALLRWPLMVLLNDGHDRFTVAISGVFPGSLGSGRRAAASQHVQDAVALVSSGSKAGGLANGGQLFLPQLQATLFSPNTRTVTNRLGDTLRYGRAPPALLTRI
jgi:hypothetical protein